MVTGTNGKTTTSRIIGQILHENKTNYITNKSGANLVSGIVTTFIEHYRKKEYHLPKTALIEIDEAAFKVITERISPDILVVTNFFRDQLDRYGELYTTVRGVREGLERCPNTQLILNADDSLCVSLAENREKVLYYGFDDNAYNNQIENSNSDASFCIKCRTKYIYNNHVFGHLGSFSCPSCGYSKPLTQVTCTKIPELNSTNSTIEMKLDQYGKIRTTINLPGLYNVYNALAGTALGYQLGCSTKTIIKALNTFECGFGRMETIVKDNKNIRIILVKNPTGFNQVINYLLTEKGNTQIAFLINDNLADGTDISWLWDVDIENLQLISDNTSVFYTSGVRGEDMSVRLKYAGIYTRKISYIKDYHELITTALSSMKENENFYILPTYTAMLDLRKILQKKFGLKAFWK